MSNNPFPSAGSAAKATLFCVGILRNVGSTAVSKSQRYYSLPFELEATGNGNNTKGTLLWVPQYFENSYVPSKDTEKGRSFVYQNNIYCDSRGYSPESSDRLTTQKVGVSTLQGICGSHEKFVEIGTELKDAFQRMTLDEFILELDKTIRGLEGTPVGYVLKQQYVESGAKNEKGYDIKVPGKYYEIAGYFHPNAEEFAKIEKSVEKGRKNNVQVYVTYDTEVPFDAAYASEN